MEKIEPEDNGGVERTTSGEQESSRESSEWRQHAPAAQRERHNTISHTGEACLITTRRMAMQDLPRG